MRTPRSALRPPRPLRAALAAVAGAALVLAAAPAARAAASPVRVAATTTERSTAPPAVAAAHPRLGWTLASSARDQRQSAYQVAVSSGRAKATGGDADVWDSGRVRSADSVDVAYAGPALRPAHRYFWRVRVWDGRGRPSAWSPVSTFTTAPDHLAGSWIGGTGSRPGLSGAHWIWYPEGDPSSSAPAATRYFRRTIDLGPSAVTGAGMTLTADDGYTLYVNGTRVAASPQTTDSWKHAQYVDLTHVLHPGTNTLAISATNTSTGPAGLIGRLHVDRDGAGPLDITTGTRFRTAQTAPDGWRQPGFDDSAWAAAADLAASVAAHDGHLTTGFLGTGGLLPALTAAGKTGTAYTILGQKTFPSWGYEIANGATTIWERWDGIKPDGTFNDPGMNSFNHYGLGSVGDWMYQAIGGLAPAAPGYRKLLVAPRPGGGLTWAKAAHDTPYGRAATAWTSRGGAFTLDVTVPVNTTAEIHLPGARTGGGPSTFTVGSGHWHFTSRT